MICHKAIASTVFIRVLCGNEKSTFGCALYTRTGMTLLGVSAYYFRNESSVDYCEVAKNIVVYSCIRSTIFICNPWFEQRESETNYIMILHLRLGMHAIHVCALYSNKYGN